MFWRLAIKPGRPVAMGEVGGMPLPRPARQPGRRLRHLRPRRPAADLAALAGGTYAPARPLPVPAAFTYRKKPGRREYVRVRIDDGRAHKHPVEGAGILTSLTQTDGLAEIADDATAVAPGDTVGFLPFATLM